MGLEDAIGGGPERVKFRKDKLHMPGLCSYCGKPGEETDYYYWRCPHNECDAITYTPVNYELDLDI